MAVLYDSALTAALGTELHARWAGRRLEAVFFDEHTRRVRLVLDRESWIWLLHPRLGSLARVELPRQGGRRRDRGVLNGRRRIDRVVVGPDTRRLSLALSGRTEADREELVFDLATNRWNAVYVTGRVRAVLHRFPGARGVRPGIAWSPRASERLWADTVPTREAWEATLKGETDDGVDLVGRVAYLSSLNRTFVFPEGAGSVDGRTFARYQEIRDAIRKAPPDGWLIPRGAGWQPYPCALGHPDAEQSVSLLGAFALCTHRVDETRRAVALASQDPDVAAIAEALEAKRDRAARKVRALQGQVEAGRGAAALRDVGHLLLARKASVPTGATEVQLEGFAGDPVVVRLDPALDAVANAELYYERARRLDRASRELPARLVAAEQAVQSLDEALAGLRERGPDPGLRAMAGLSPDARLSATDQSQRLPYRVYRTTHGLEIRAGRSARDNDLLTFRHSSPEDIWMHVREAPGSHVVLRWSRRDQTPPARDMTEAAVVAAVMSRARGASLVPVVWTRRKHVRKPRKAGPGTVVTQRTKTLFVEPDPQLVARLEVDADDLTAGV